MEYHIYILLSFFCNVNDTVFSEELNQHCSKSKTKDWNKIPARNPRYEVYLIKPTLDRGDKTLVNGPPRLGNRLGKICVVSNLIHIL